jgi:protein AbiQ
MKQPRLNLYTVNMKYIRNLSHVDSHVFSVSPQIGKSTRPFIGVIIICDDKQYCVPLSSPKPKHITMKNDIDFSKVFGSDGKLIGVLNFNNMIPVNASVITKIDLKIHAYDSISVKKYKNLTIDQLTFCQKNQDAIVRKANKLYRLITQNKANNMIKRRCCRYTELEKVLLRFIESNT